MESKNELTETDIKNCMCYYFDDIMRVRDRDISFSDILLDKNIYKEKYKNILIYGISYKTLAGAKPLYIRFNEIDGFIKIHDGIRYLVLFGCGFWNEICDRIKYLVSEKSGIADNINHNFASIGIDSYDSLPIEKILTFHSVMILIKSVINQYKNHYYYNMFFRKWVNGLYKDKSNTEYFKMNFCVL